MRCRGCRRVTNNANFPPFSELCENCVKYNQYVEGTGPFANLGLDTLEYSANIPQDVMEIKTHTQNLTKLVERQTATIEQLSNRIDKYEKITEHLVQAITGTASHQRTDDHQKQSSQPSIDTSQILFQEVEMREQNAATASESDESGGKAVGTGGTTVKFYPLPGIDTMLRNGISQSINTKFHCITCMKEYEDKSLEELRLEDYGANRKGPILTAQDLFGRSCGFLGVSGQATCGSNSDATNTVGSYFGSNNTDTTFAFGTQPAELPFGKSTEFAFESPVKTQGTELFELKDKPGVVTTRSTLFPFGMGSSSSLNRPVGTTDPIGAGGNAVGSGGYSYTIFPSTTFNNSLVGTSSTRVGNSTAGNTFNKPTSGGQASVQPFFGDSTTTRSSVGINSRSTSTTASNSKGTTMKKLPPDSRTASAFGSRSQSAPPSRPISSVTTAFDSRFPPTTQVGSNPQQTSVSGANYRSPTIFQSDFKKPWYDSAFKPPLESCMLNKTPQELPAWISTLVSSNSGTAPINSKPSVIGTSSQSLSTISSNSRTAPTTSKIASEFNFPIIKFDFSKKSSTGSNSQQPVFGSNNQQSMSLNFGETSLKTNGQHFVQGTNLKESTSTNTSQAARDTKTEDIKSADGNEIIQCTAIATPSPVDLTMTMSSSSSLTNTDEVSTKESVVTHTSQNSQNGAGGDSGLNIENMANTTSNSQINDSKSTKEEDHSPEGSVSSQQQFQTIPNAVSNHLFTLGSFGQSLTQYGAGISEKPSISSVPSMSNVSPIMTPSTGSPAATSAVRTIEPAAGKTSIKNSADSASGAAASCVKSEPNVFSFGQTIRKSVFQPQTPLVFNFGCNTDQKTKGTQSAKNTECAEIVTSASFGSSSFTGSPSTISGVADATESRETSTSESPQIRTTVGHSFDSINRSINSRTNQSSSQEEVHGCASASSPLGTNSQSSSTSLADFQFGGSYTTFMFNTNSDDYSVLGSIRTSSLFTTNYQVSSTVASNLGQTIDGFATSTQVSSTVTSSSKPTIGVNASQSVRDENANAESEEIVATESSVSFPESASPPLTNAGANSIARSMVTNHSAENATNGITLGQKREDTKFTDPNDDKSEIVTTASFSFTTLSNPSLRNDGAVKTACSKETSTSKRSQIGTTTGGTNIFSNMKKVENSNSLSLTSEFKPPSEKGSVSIEMFRFGNLGRSCTTVGAEFSQKSFITSSRAPEFNSFFSGTSSTGSNATTSAAAIIKPDYSAISVNNKTSTTNLIARAASRERTNQAPIASSYPAFGLPEEFVKVLEKYEKSLRFAENNVTPPHRFAPSYCTAQSGMFSFQTTRSETVQPDAVQTETKVFRFSAEDNYRSPLVSDFSMCPVSSFYSQRSSKWSASSSVLFNFSSSATTSKGNMPTFAAAVIEPAIGDTVSVESETSTENSFASVSRGTSTVKPETKEYGCNIESAFIIDYKPDGSGEAGSSQQLEFNGVRIKMIHNSASSRKLKFYKTSLEEGVISTGAMFTIGRSEPSRLVRNRMK